MVFNATKITVDAILLNKFIASFTLVLLLWMPSCAPVESRTPGAETMQFPYSMSLFGNRLVVSATSTDGRYDQGRLVAIDTTAIKTKLDGKEIPWSKVVVSNILTPRNVGKIIISKNAITFTERQKGTLLSIPAASGTFINDPFLPAEKVPGIATLSFFNGEAEQDTSGLLALKETDTKDTFLVSYLSSDRIDVVELDKGVKLSLNSVRHFFGKSILKFYAEPKDLKNRRVVTKAMAMTNQGDESRVYFLFELHYEKSTLLKNSKAVMLVVVKLSDLLAGPLEKPMVKIFNLKKELNIFGARDLFVDEKLDQALILASNPQALYKIDLKDGRLLKMNSVCAKASTMAVSTKLDLVVIPCVKDDQVMSYSYSRIDALDTSDVVGRSPVYAVIDESNGLIYCSYYLDGMVAIFDRNLNYQGHFFDRLSNKYVGK